MRWLEVIVKEGLWGIGGRVEVILPSLAGLHQGEMGDLGETSARSVGVAGFVLSVLQRSFKEGTLFAIGTLGRGQLLKRLGDMEPIQAIRRKMGGGGRGEGLLRTAPRQALRAEDQDGFARAIGAAQGKTLSVGTITVNRNQRVGKLLMEKKGPGAWNEESQAAVQASLESEKGLGLVAKRNAAASVAGKFKGSDGSACATILSSKLTSENVKAVSMADAGLPRDKVPSEVGLARIASVLELLSESVGQRTYEGVKAVVETINERLPGIDGEVAEEGMKGVEDFLWEAILARQRALLRWVASGFQGEFEPAGREEVDVSRSEPPVRPAGLVEGQAKWGG
jgi:hypothetical protein